MAQVLASQSLPSFGYHVRVYGSSGDVGERGRNLFQPELSVFSTVTPAFRDPAIIHPILHGDAISTMLVPELREFAKSIIESRPSAITTADGRRGRDLS